MVGKKMLKSWKEHKKKWVYCDGCELHQTRCNIVLARGKLPCDVLFVGEAPGRSEDITGQPMIGPAGKLLDQVIKKSMSKKLRFAFTNLIACIPLDEDGDKVKEPHKEHIKACSERLREMIILSEPIAVVAVGKLSAQVLSQHDDIIPHSVPSIDHPAFVLRSDVTNRGLLLQKMEITLRDISERVLKDLELHVT